MHLSLLRRALGRAYLAFSPADERWMLLDMLSRSTDPEARIAVDRRRTQAMSALDRRDLAQRYAPLIQTLADNISSSVASLR
jgi:IclR family mhp operon transcriptional activator